MNLYAFKKQNQTIAAAFSNVKCFFCPPFTILAQCFIPSDQLAIIHLFLTPHSKYPSKSDRGAQQATVHGVAKGSD